MTRRREGFLPYTRHRLDEEDVAAVSKVLRGELLTGGETTKAFEAALARRLDAGFAIATSSGTAALHLAAMAVDLGPGDRAVVPSVTFAATANVVRLTGAEVVFCDVDPASGLMGAEHFREALARAGNGAVKAVLPVHLGGQAVDLPSISALAREAGCVVIEDACHAVGTRARDDGGEHAVGACRHSHAAAFSFHPAKTIAMGEGGALLTNDEALAGTIALHRSHGIERERAAFTTPALALDGNGEVNPWYYEVASPGLNYRPSDIHCALGLSQLGKLDRFLADRARLVELYDRLMEPLAPRVRPVARVPWSRPGWHLYTVLVDFPATGRSRAELMRRLAARGIGTQVHYIPLHMQPYYRDRAGPLSLPGAEAYYERALSLPLSSAMGEDDVAFVAEVLAEEMRS